MDVYSYTIHGDRFPVAGLQRHAPIRASSTGAQFDWSLSRSPFTTRVFLDSAGNRAWPATFHFEKLARRELRGLAGHTFMFEKLATRTLRGVENFHVDTIFKSFE